MTPSSEVQGPTSNTQREGGNGAELGLTSGRACPGRQHHSTQGERTPGHPDLQGRWDHTCRERLDRTGAGRGPAGTAWGHARRVRLAVAGPRLPMSASQKTPVHHPALHVHRAAPGGDRAGPGPLQVHSADVSVQTLSRFSPSSSTWRPTGARGPTPCLPPRASPSPSFLHFRCPPQNVLGVRK